MTQGLLANLWLIALSVAMGVGGQTAIKLGVSRPSATGLEISLPSVIQVILGSPLVLLGLAMYGVGGLSWVLVLSRMDLSYAYPFLALNFVLVALVAWLLLGESIPGLRWLGIGCICIGILLVAWSSVAAR